MVIVACPGPQPVAAAGTYLRFCLPVDAAVGSAAREVAIGEHEVELGESGCATAMARRRINESPTAGRDR